MVCVWVRFCRMGGGGVKVWFGAPYIARGQTALRRREVLTPSQTHSDPPSGPFPHSHKTLGTKITNNYHFLTIVNHFLTTNFWKIFRTLSHVKITTLRVKPNYSTEQLPQKRAKIFVTLAGGLRGDNLVLVSHISISILNFWPITRKDCKRSFWIIDDNLSFNKRSFYEKIFFKLHEISRIYFYLIWSYI